MQVAQKYLDEIEEILKKIDDGLTIEDVVRFHWRNPNKFAGLFGYAHTCRYNPSGCGCLTQVHDGSYVAMGYDGSVDFDLTGQIQNDTRLHNCVSDIADAMKGETREGQRAILMPYAEWQTRLEEMRSNGPS